MKLLKTGIFASALLSMAMFSCGEKAKTSEVASGVVFDASMNNISIITSNGDTVNISTMNTNPSKVPGVLLSDSVKVYYSQVDMDGVAVLQADSLFITAHSPYYYIQGTWTEANPINQDQHQGFTLNQNGSASSINMATLEIKNWNLADLKTLILETISIGNKQTITSFDTMSVVKLNADSLVLAQDGNVIWRLARTK